MKFAKLAELVATLFGLGKLTHAPGTLGSLVACLLFLALPASWVLPALILVIVFGLFASHIHAKSKGVTDPGEIIIDEVAGQWIGLWGHVIWGTAGMWLLPGLALFRFFDILKPWPIKYFEKLPGGLGIMADDIVAGVLANLTLVVLRYLFLNQGGTGLLLWF